MPFLLPSGSPDVAIIKRQNLIRSLLILIHHLQASESLLQCLIKIKFYILTLNSQITIFWLWFCNLVTLSIHEKGKTCWAVQDERKKEKWRRRKNNPKEKRKRGKWQRRSLQLYNSAYNAVLTTLVPGPYIHNDDDVISTTAPLYPQRRRYIHNGAVISTTAL